jgi:3-hydroxyisobutyrate dehydrogenase
MASVTVLGLGQMGTRIARRLVDAGHAVVVWDRTPARTTPLLEAGAAGAATPREAALGAELVLSSVRDGEASRAVWLADHLGALHGLAPGAVAAECSTTTVGWVRELAVRVAGAGGAFLDAPVVGSTPQAEAGALVQLVGGDAAALERVRPVLGAFAGTVLHAGEAGHAMAVKLAVNALYATQVAALGELLGALRGQGVDPARALGLVAGLPVVSPALAAAAAAVVAGDPVPTFQVRLVEKDLRCLLDAAADAPVTAAVHAEFAARLAAGGGDLHLTAVADRHLGRCGGAHRRPRAAGRGAGGGRAAGGRDGRPCTGGLTCQAHRG